MSIYNPLSSSFNPLNFLSYGSFNVTESLITGSSERTPTSSANLYSGSIFVLSASAAYTAGLNIQTEVSLISYIYNNNSAVDPSSSLFNQNNNFYNTNGGSTNVAHNIEGPIRITTGSITSHTTGSIRIGLGRILRIIDGENFTITPGCVNPSSFNYNAGANLDDGSCILPIYGCTDPNSTNYNPAANIDDGSCTISGCTDPTAINYNPLATINNGACQYVTSGTFINTNTTTTHIDNSYASQNILGQIQPKILTTNGSILMRSSGEAYVGSYHITTYNSANSTFKQIYVAGSTPSNRPTQFISGDILVLRNGNRKYTDNNDIISNKLPQAYKQPTSQEQLCSNCVFWDASKNLNCTRWKAKIRTNYWCAKYKPLGVLTSAGDTFRSNYPGITQTGLTTGGNEFLLNNRSFYIGSYRIMSDGAYFADDVLPFRKLTLKQTLKIGPKRHFTKINKNLTTQKITIKPTTTPSTTIIEAPVSTPTVSTGGAGTSYSY